jgi:glycerate dehydrogenase
VSEKVRIVVLDGHTLDPGDNPWDELASLGDLTVYERTPPELTVERARGADVVLTNKTRLDAAALAELPSLRFVAVLATGYDVVDVAAAAQHGIPVANVPEYGTDSVAQHVFALLLELCHRVGEHDRAVERGDWQRSPDFSFWLTPPIELAGKTMGIVGHGRIGRRVADIARAFGMSVLVSGRTRPAVTDATWVATDELFERSDVVSLHCPLTEATRALVDRTMLARMRPTAFLINTARGPLVDEEALAQALREGVIAGAGLDVVAVEPMRADNPLRDAPNCVITPHLAWASLAARRRLMGTAVENVRAFLAGSPIHVVNSGAGGAGRGVRRS